MLLPTFLAAIPDHRRAQGRRHGLEHVLLFSMLAILSDATSYRKIQRFIAARLPRLNALRGLRWKRAPAHTAIRYALQGLDPADVESAFRGHAAVLAGSPADRTPTALDGNTLRGSFERFQDQKALQILSALSTDRTWILGHVLINGTDKSHELPVARWLIEERGLSEQLFTLDALHCQKNS